MPEEEVRMCPRCKVRPVIGGRRSYCASCEPEMKLLSARYAKGAEARKRDFDKLVEWCRENDIRELARRVR